MKRFFVFEIPMPWRLSYEPDFQHTCQDLSSKADAMQSVPHVIKLHRPSTMLQFITDLSFPLHPIHDALKMPFMIKYNVQSMKN